MHKLVALFLILAFWMSPVVSTAYIKIPTASPGGGLGGFFKPCGDPTSCAIFIGIQVFLILFESKLACLFGSETDMFAKGLSPSTVVKNETYDNIAGVRSLTDTIGSFGGQILSKQPCKCGAKLGVKDVIMVGPPKRTMVAVTSATKVYDYKATNDGNWVLGISTNEIVCRIPKALGIAKIGTSR